MLLCACHLCVVLEYCANPAPRPVIRHLLQLPPPPSAAPDASRSARLSTLNYRPNNPLLAPLELSDEFTGPPLQLFVGTWNAGDSHAPDVDRLAQWIIPERYDVYAIGLQECPHRDEWVRAVEKLLGASPAKDPAVAKLDQGQEAAAAGAPSVAERYVEGFLCRQW